MFENLDCPKLLQAAAHFQQVGCLKSTPEMYTYLDIEDDYIHVLFPQLKKQYPQVLKPHYFGKKLAGAHISVIYPEEKICIDQKDVNIKHKFKITTAMTAELGRKKYYALMVDSPSLLAVRKKYGLADKLPFKGHLIGLHITIGFTWL